MIDKRIKKLRIENNLTQKDLAISLNLTPKMISFYELRQRTPPSDIILKLADIFNVSTDYLLGRTDIKNHNQTTAAPKTDDFMNDLPEEALQSIEDFKKFVRAKYKKD